MMCFALMLAALCAGAENAGVYTREKEAKLGAVLAEEVRKTGTVIDSPALRDYAGRVGRQFAAQLPAGTVASYTFEIVNARETGTHEPISLPGGYIFVPRALFLAAANEAEFAGMIAHAMAHAAARHGVRQATSGATVNYASIPLIFMGGWDGFGEGGNAVPAGFLDSMRAFELEADLLAVQAISRAGYDPAALAAYIGRTQAAAPSSPLPPREARLAALRKAISPSAGATEAPGAEFRLMQEEARRVVPERPRRAPSLYR